jgi:hypothetical protein
MKRLRHPIRAITEPFGKAGLIVAVIALVLALTGAAFAATGLNGKQKKEVEKIAKKFAGKPGAAGAQGPAGPAGPAGAAGKDGANGKDGAAGSPGKAGATGATGATGFSGFTETLPSGKTETGAWTVQGWHEGALGTGAISFPIPLEVNLGETEVVFLEPGEGETEECPGTVGAPEAKTGFLCVYTFFSGLEPALGVIHNPAESPFGPAGAGSTGAVLTFALPEGEEFAGAQGTWAVTAP